MKMSELNALLKRQYKQYRNRMNYIARQLHWTIHVPYERMFRIGQIR
jgi:hypothetical protein